MLSEKEVKLLLSTVRKRKHIDISLPQLISLISGTGYVHHFFDPTETDFVMIPKKNHIRNLFCFFTIKHRHRFSG